MAKLSLKQLRELQQDGYDIVDESGSPVRDRTLRRLERKSAEPPKQEKPPVKPVDTTQDLIKALIVEMKNNRSDPNLSVMMSQLINVLKDLKPKEKKKHFRLKIIDRDVKGIKEVDLVEL